MIVIGAIVLVAGASGAPMQADDHPTLSQMWTALVREADVGVVHESENYVPNHTPPTASNPCAKWTNYTDGSCQRLIYQPDGNSELAMRYLLGCDAVDCCKEQGEGPIEYQIPNIHPPALAHVRSLGKHDVTLFNGEKVTTDGWTWKFTMENFTVYTTPTSGSDFATLYEWGVHIDGDDVVNQYVNYTIIPESERAAWSQNFQIPEICKGNIVNCNTLHKQGKLSDKSIKFLRAKSYRTVTGLGSK